MSAPLNPDQFTDTRPLTDLSEDERAAAIQRAARAGLAAGKGGRIPTQAEWDARRKAEKR